MIKDLQEFIEKLKISGEQKSHLQLLLEKDRQDLLNTIQDFLHSIDSNEYPRKGYRIANEKSERLVIELDKEMEKVTEVLNVARRTVLEVNESYNKINLLLSKKEIWLADLVEKLSKVSNRVSDQFINILQNARDQLSEIDGRVDASWQRFIKEKDVMEKNLITQVTDIREQQKDNRIEVELGEEKIDRMCEVFGEEIGKKSKVFTTDLQKASEDIEKLTLLTTKKMKQVTRAKKLDDLEKQIANI